MKRKPPAPRRAARAALGTGLQTLAPAPTGIVTPARSLEDQLRSHPLARVFQDALAQATRGKGDARHGQGRDSVDADNFLRQDWRAIAVRHGPAFLSGQAEKKLREALALPHPERRTELLGVLVYVAMLVIHHDKGGA